MTKIILLVFVLLPMAFAEAPFACNLKAFQPEERKEWRRLIDHVMMSVTAVKQLPDGYALTVDTKQASIVEVAQWIDLERKCCPFFNFEVSMHGENGALTLALKGREGVKQFIAEDFHQLMERFPTAKLKR
jgi:hypothetical protein